MKPQRAKNKKRVGDVSLVGEMMKIQSGHVSVILGRKEHELHGEVLLCLEIIKDTHEKMIANYHLEHPEL